MKIMLCGASGQLGRQVCALAQQPEFAGIEVKALDSQALDICDADAVMSLISDYRPDVVINAAAYTAVDKAETDSDKAFAVNCTAVENLALACRSNNCPMLHVSTDYVFDGLKSSAYSEVDSCNPQGVYGQSKYAGEQVLANTWSRSLVMRVSWVFGLYGNNFVKTMLALAERESLGIVADQYGAPMAANAIAGNLLLAAKQAINEPEDAEFWGVWHMCSGPAVSWYDFAQVIFNRAEHLSLLERQPELQALSTAQYPTVAPRPANSLLTSKRINSPFDVCDWKKELDIVLQGLKDQR